jgi:hypothetical protein
LGELHLSVEIVHLLAETLHKLFPFRICGVLKIICDLKLFFLHICFGTNEVFKRVLIYLTIPLPLFCFRLVGERVLALL